MIQSSKVEAFKFSSMAAWEGGTQGSKDPCSVVASVLSWNLGGLLAADGALHCNASTQATASASAVHRTLQQHNHSLHPSF